MRWIVRIDDGSPEGLARQFDISRPVVLGRAPPADIVVDHPSVSLGHARLEPEADGLTVTDLGSSNGSFVDSLRIDRSTWQPGQRLQVGKVALVFVGARPPKTRSLQTKAVSTEPQSRVSAWLAHVRSFGRRANREHRIVWTRSGVKVGECRLEAKRNLVIGSDLGCDIVLDDPLVSQRHAQLSFRRGVVSVTDLASRNGVWIDGTRVQTSLLSSETLLSIGPFTLSMGRLSDADKASRAMQTIVQPANRFEKSVRDFKERQSVFISYSRLDQAFADRMQAMLSEKDFDVLIDRHHLPFGEAWKEELAALIRNCDTLLFLVTANSVASETCNWELQVAEGLRKRIFPILVEPVKVLPAALNRVNLLPSPNQGGFSFDRHVASLIFALNTDQAWVKEHSRLQSRAREWIGKGKTASLLLRGKSLQIARQWLKATPAKSTPSAPVQELIRISTYRQHVRRAAAAAPAGLIAVFAAIGIGSMVNPPTILVDRFVPVLQPYQVSFCGQLRDALQGRDITVNDGRCVLPTDITFETSRAELTAEGRKDMDKLATVIANIDRAIEADGAHRGAPIAWVLQIDGHTDKRSISTLRFQSNWELSTARATTAVRYLVDNHKIPASRLAAGGHGENRPLASGNDDESLRRNRRIELRLASP